nr:thioesterase family protein [uncultured Bacillus sp.]
MKRIKYIEDFEKWQREFSFFYPIKVRFSETDLFGHLNNSSAFIYLEEARIEFLKHIGLMGKYLASDNDLICVAADMQCDYLKQIYFDERINVYVKANFIGNSSVDLHYLAKNEQGETCLTGRGALVQISKATGKGVSWSGEERNLLKTPRSVQISS